MMDWHRVWEHIERLVAPFLLIRSRIYRPLHPGEIRVISLAAGKWNDRLTCTLKTVSLDDDPSYETLSYVWGDPRAGQKIILLQDQLFPVTRNLESALRHLRHEDWERTIWIDAVCINQEDRVEKAAQVGRMEVIYARTSHLFIWVGEASEAEDSDLGMETLRQVGEELKADSLWSVDLANVSSIKDSLQNVKDFNPKPWVAVNRLFRRDWFERVWVIQEVCKPDGQMSFVCGRKSVPWHLVSWASHAIGGYRWGPEQSFALTQAGFDPINMDAPVEVIREMWKSQDSVVEAECTLLKQLWHFRSRKCGDPRDKVFAILGICKDLKREDITVDYIASVAHVYSEVSKFIIMQDCSLKLLSACQSYGSNIAELPSWAPDWSIEARFRPMRPISNWTGDEERDIFNASKNFTARVEISADLRTMNAQGLHIGKISKLGMHLGNDGTTTETPETRKEMFTQFKQWWPLARDTRSKSTSNDERRLEFWRTICTDMDSSGGKAAPNEGSAQYLLRIATWDLAAPPQPDENAAGGSGGDDHRFMDFLASFQQATRNRRLFVTEEGHVGLGPLLTRPGDLVCILFGSPVPFVLRAVEGGRVVLVGECYCHGVMEGEAVRGLGDDHSTLREFIIE